ncbi:hypothetical protein [Nocardiopsis xinjiangensis]|uniref:hypothetical protein n=1 Tax=Nocardiopsis xinjiangensis TaxID=124285 RepID=UPI000476B560|nr:hypothetical protein [Nocardiopsis xinjiangensis]
MSDNGPHNQPPQNPYGGGEGQPPYGPPPGGDPSGGQPPMPPGQPGGMPGQPGYGAGAPPGYGTGGQPGYGPQGPPGQPMYGGGQPPYGGPGGPVPPPQNGGGKGGSKASLWVVLGGGAVIIVLVVAVIVTLINNSGGDEVATEPTEEASESTTDPDQADDTGGEEEPEGTTNASGEAPYSVPTEPCEALTGDVESNFLLVDEGNKSVQDNTSTCSSSMADPPEGNDSDAYGSFDISYSVPYSNNESDAEASVEYERGVEEVTGQSDYGLYLDEVMEETEVDLGDEAYFVVNGYDFAGEDIPVATLLVRTANLNIRLEYQLHGAYDQETELEDFTMPEDVQDLMVAAGEDALAQVGS